MFLSGCATVTGGKTEALHIDSSPAGATVELSCETSGTYTTPAIVRVPRRAEPCVATVSLAGYETRRVEMERGIAPAYWLNLIGAVALPLAGNESFNSRGTALAIGLAGVGGLIYDRVSGGKYDHEPRRITVKLTQTVSRSSQ